MYVLETPSLARVVSEVCAGLAEPERRQQIDAVTSLLHVCCVAIASRDSISGELFSRLLSVTAAAVCHGEALADALRLVITSVLQFLQPCGLQPSTVWRACARKAFQLLSAVVIALATESTDRASAAAGLLLALRKKLDTSGVMQHADFGLLVSSALAELWNSLAAGECEDSLPSFRGSRSLGLAAANGTPTRSRLPEDDALVMALSPDRPDCIADSWLDANEPLSCISALIHEGHAIDVVDAWISRTVGTSRVGATRLLALAATSTTLSGEGFSFWALTDAGTQWGRRCSLR